jgi:hypothetical protein
MKICPQCDDGYPDIAVTCPIHGGLLSEQTACEWLKKL